MDLPAMVATARRHLLLLVVATLLGLAAGGAFTGLSSPQYRSSSTVMFSLDRGSSVSELAEGTTFTQELAPSYAKVVTMPIVLDPVVQRLRLPYTSTQLARHITVQLDQGSLIMQVVVTDSSAGRTTDIAKAVADELIATVPTLSVQAEDQARVSVTTISGSVAAATSSSHGLATGLGLGAAAGLVLAIGIAVIFELAAASPLVRDRRAAAEIVSAPVLADVPHDPDARRRPLPVSTHPYLARAESYRLLQTGLDLVRHTEDPLAIAVCAPARGNGSTSTATNLAVALCRVGRRVLLVDADLHHPAVADALGLPDGLGLTEVLTTGATWQEQVRTWRPQAAGNRTLGVLTTRAAPDEAGDLIASPAMRVLLEQARVDYDVVVVDCPDLLSVVDAAAVAAQVDGVLLVLDARTSRQRTVGEAADRLRMAGGQILGVVMNRTAGDHRTQTPPRAVPPTRRTARIPDGRPS
jgi:succinoglycan biosynthesis transport protein ExoP